jgi:glycosyltransferase involved in cell wall biosynthesis
MRVGAFVLGTANPLSISGGDRYALEVLRSWHERGIAHVVVFTSQAGASVMRRYGYELPVQVVEARSRDLGTYRTMYLPRALRALRHVLRTNPKFDAIFAGSAFFYDVLPSLVLARRARRATGRRPLLFAPIFHLIPPPHRRAGNALVNVLAFIEQRAMVSLVSRAYDVVVVDNEGLVRGLGASHRALRGKLYLTAMGVRRSAAARSSEAPHGAYAISVARLSAAKGPAMLLDAWRLVRSAGEPITLLLAGAPDESFALPRELRRRELDDGSVRVRIGASDAELAALVDGAAFAVSASREEGFGLAILEALAAGLPCVTFDLPPFREAFPHGRLVPQSPTARAFADRVLELARDPALLARLRAEIAEHYRFASWDQVADDLWERVTSAAPGSHSRAVGSG